MTRPLHTFTTSRPVAPMQMASGRIVDLAHLTSDDIHWPDLVEALVKLPRFGGATPHVTYSTAQHCCLMYDRAEDSYKAKALLADFHCAYFGEINRSFRHFAAHLSGDPQGFLENFYLARDEITATIWQAAGLAEDATDAELSATADALRTIDKRLTAAERRDLMAPCADRAFWQLPEPYPYAVKPWGADRAREQLELRLTLIGVHPRG